jgi:hypothetical protein
VLRLAVGAGVVLFTAGLATVVLTEFLLVVRGVYCVVAGADDPADEELPELALETFNKRDSRELLDAVLFFDSSLLCRSAVCRALGVGATVR